MISGPGMWENLCLLGLLLDAPGGTLPLPVNTQEARVRPPG